MQTSIGIFSTSLVARILTVPLFWKVNDIIGLVLPDSHERTSGIAVVIQMVPSALAGRETAVVAFLQYVRMVPKIERRRAFEGEDVLLFLEMIVKLIRIFAGPKFIDANSDMRTPAYLPSRLNRSLPGSCSHGMSSMLNGSKLPCPFLVVVSFAMMETSSPGISRPFLPGIF
jgi:hypothetical protein